MYLRCLGQILVELTKKSDERKKPVYFTLLVRLQLARAFADPGQAYVNNLDLASDYVVRLTSDFTSPQALEQSFYLLQERSDAERALKSVSTLEERFRSVLKVSLLGELFFD